MEQSDFDYALSLHFMLNGESAIENLTVIEPTEKLKDPKREDSSSDEETFQEILVKRQKTNNDEYFLPSIKTWISVNDPSSDWSEVKLYNNNIQMIFDKLKHAYFDKSLANVKCVVKWDETGIIIDDCCYKIFKETNYQAFVSMSTILRPRIQLISVLLHILIHLYVTTKSKGKITISHHGAEFKRLMHFFNDRIETKITTGHNFLYNQDESHYPNQWWQCTGICLNYEPFHGVIRCQQMPNEAMCFWKTHHAKCGGTFFKIFEAERHLGDGSVEKKYVRNVKYLNPRAKNDEQNNPTQRRNFATHSQVRAQIDLTDEAEPKEKNLCTVINLDESEFIVDDSDDDEQANGWECEEIITFCDGILKKCFLCHEIVGESRLPSHLDSCTGFQQNVAFDLKKLLK